MISSDALVQQDESENQGEGSSDSSPETTIETKKKRNKKQKTLSGLEGRPPVLSFPERVEAWHKHVLGADIFALAVEYGTSAEQVQAGISAVIAELGYPHDHIDPELERFRIVEASERMKVALVKILNESNTILKELNQAREVIKGGMDISDLDDEKGGKNAKMEYFSLLAARQGELKTVVSLLAEYRATNLVIAELTGIKRTKMERKPKKVITPEEQLEGLSTAQLLELAEN